MVRGHKEKILTIENTEDTENRWLALFICLYFRTTKKDPALEGLGARV
jgi:hypothetical protein